MTRHVHCFPRLKKLTLILGFLRVREVLGYSHQTELLRGKKGKSFKQTNKQKSFFSALLIHLEIWWLMSCCLGNHDRRRERVRVCVCWWGILSHLHPVPHPVSAESWPCLCGPSPFAPGIILLSRGLTVGCLSLIIFSGWAVLMDGVSVSLPKGTYNMIRGSGRLWESPPRPPWWEPPSNEAAAASGWFWLLESLVRPLSQVALGYGHIWSRLAEAACLSPALPTGGAWADWRVGS